MTLQELVEGDRIHTVVLDNDQFMVLCSDGTRYWDRELSDMRGSDCVWGGGLLRVLCERQGITLEVE